MWSEFHFLRPLWLLLLPVAIWVYWAVQKSEDPLRGWRRLIDPVLLDAFRVDANDKAFNWKGPALLVVWCSLVVALSGPTWSLAPSPFNDEPLPAMILFHASGSMETTDLQPSRLERAQLKVVDLVRELKGIPLGLIAYSGSAHLVLPPTKDAEIVGEMAGELSPQIMPGEGNQLAAAMTLAQESFSEEQGTVIVLSDTAPRDGIQNSLNGVGVMWLDFCGNDQAERAGVEQFCRSARGTFVSLTADSEDVQTIADVLRRKQAIPNADADARWSEPGWWLLPIAAVFALYGFRRESHSPEEKRDDG